MHKVVLFGAVATLLLAASGCSQHSQVVRGQGAEYCEEDISGAYGAACPGGPGGHCRAFGGGAAANYNRQDLYYPPQGAAPGIVQYPYYTCKGPDCFFHQ